MTDYILIEKIWQDIFCYQVKITCASSHVVATNDIYISDDSKSDFYEKEAIKASWLVRELKRQISVFHYSRDCCYRMAKLIKRKFF